MPDYGDVGRAFEDEQFQHRPKPDTEAAVYGTEQVGELSVEGVAAALAALNDDGQQATLAAFDIAASGSSAGGGDRGD